MMEYKVVLYRESLLGSLLLGESKVDTKKFSNFLNTHAEDGWEVVTMEKEKRRALIFFSREAFLVILRRKK